MAKRKARPDPAEVRSVPVVHGERDALLQAVIDHPDDDVPRLVYADWQDENGDAEHAELIRVQCEFDTLLGVRGEAKRRAELLARVKVLLKRPGFRVGRSPYFTRGFFENLRLEWKVPPRRPALDVIGPGYADLSGRVPFDRVLTLDVDVRTGPAAPLDELAAADWAGRLGDLTLGDSAEVEVYDRQALGPLLGCPRLGNLKYLTVWTVVVDAAALADLALALPRLRHLRFIYDAQTLGGPASLAKELRRIGRSKVPALEHLMLNTPDFTDAVAEVVLGSPRLRGLHVRGSLRHLSAAMRKRFAAALSENYGGD